jgi:hypothetical protein
MAHIYQMTSEQSAVWESDDEYGQLRVENAILEVLNEANITDDVQVLLDNGSIAYTMEYPDPMDDEAPF